MPAKGQTEAKKDVRPSGLAVGAGFDIFFRIAEAHHGYIPGAKLALEDRETLTLAQDLRENAPLRGLLEIIDAAHRATEQECTCGGNPANDPACCPACKVYHRLEAAKVASMSNNSGLPRSGERGPGQSGD